jgi:hypothetical protein
MPCVNVGPFPVRTSTLLLSAGSPVLWGVVGAEVSEPSLSQPSYSVLFVFLLLCLVPVASIGIRRSGRSVEFSFDQEAQDTIGSLQWLKSLKMDPGVRNVARGKQVYIELVMEALLITIYLSVWGRSIYS